MRLYAVSLKNEGVYHFGDAWIEFYWADDDEHAREQAEDMNASAEILTIAFVPYEVSTGVRA